MNKAVLILIGAAIGCLITLLVTSIQRQNEKEKIEATMDVVKEFYDMANKEPEPVIQYIEVVGKNGKVTLHNHMSKDSVEILLGKPDKATMRSYGIDDVRENWEYNIKNANRLDLDFKNGMLTDVNQY